MSDKQASGRLFRRIVSALPWRLRTALLEEICRQRDPYLVMSDLAQQCGIVRITAGGKYGRCQSAVRDRDVLRTYALTSNWASATNETLAKFFADRGRGTYIDIGANIGLTTIAVAQNPNVHCIAIEPEPENFANLAANIAANCPHANVETLQAALSDSDGKVTLGISSDNLGDHRIRREDLPTSRPGVIVDSRRLDNLFDKINGSLAVKIDTQGAEELVIAGGQKVLARAELLNLEFDPKLILYAGGDPDAVIRFLERNFSCGQIAFRDVGKPSEPMPIFEVAEKLRSAMPEATKVKSYWFDVTVAKRRDTL